MVNTTEKGQSKRPYLFSVLLGALSLVALFLPFARYTYKNVVYQLSGFDMMVGKFIMGGSVKIGPVLVLIVFGVAGVLALAAAVLGLAGVFSAKRSSKFTLLFSLIQILGCAMFIFMLSSTLIEVKKPGTEWGLYPAMLIVLANIIIHVWVLYQMRSLSALDFMVIPGMLYLVINNYLPMIGISIAFVKVDYAKGLWNSAFVGLDNFKYLFSSSDAFVITRNTLLYNLAFIIVGNFMGVLVGICLAEVFSKRLQKIYQTLILLPHLISIVIVAYIVYGFLSSASGWVNMTFFRDNPVDFYSTKKYWPFLLVFVNTWIGIGYSSIIYLSSIVGIDKSLYEAATIDGCSNFAMIRKITLPLLKPTIFTLVTLAVGRIFYSNFGLFYQVPMDSGALYSVTNTIDTYVYRSLMKLNNISMASAASAYQAIVGFVIVLTFNLIVRKVNKENALF